MMRRLLGLLLCSLAPQVAWSQSCALSCTISDLALMQFGNYDPLGSDIDAATSISVSCSFLLSLSCSESYSIQISPSAGGSLVPRRMEFLGQLLNYNLYTTPARSVVWGDGSQGSSAVNGSISAPILGGVRSNDHTVYGRLFGNQNVGAGSYTDTLTLTVIY